MNFLEIADNPRTMFIVEIFDHCVLLTGSLISSARETSLLRNVTHALKHSFEYILDVTLLFLSGVKVGTR